jgi:RNA polymerase sigma-70 factor (ECF subfamily)
LFPIRPARDALTALPTSGAAAAAPIIRCVPTERAPESGSNAASDEALLAAYAAGDAASFTRLYERHERPVFRFLRRSAGDDAIAQDLLQEVWLSVIRNAAAFEPRARFTTWLYGIARSRLIDHWRARRDLVSLDQEAANDGEAAIERLAAGADCEPEVRAMSRAEAMAFVAAVEQLPAAQREAFLLHAEGGLTVEEVAQASGVGRETAKSRLRYAMTRLRAAMEPWR